MSEWPLESCRYIVPNQVTCYVLLAKQGFMHSARAPSFVNVPISSKEPKPNYVVMVAALAVS